MDIQIFLTSLTTFIAALVAFIVQSYIMRDVERTDCYIATVSLLKSVIEGDKVMLENMLATVPPGMNEIPNALISLNLSLDFSSIPSSYSKYDSELLDRFVRHLMFREKIAGVKKIHINELNEFLKATNDVLELSKSALQMIKKKQRMLTRIIRRDGSWPFLLP